MKNITDYPNSCTVMCSIECIMEGHVFISNTLTCKYRTRKVFYFDKDVSLI